MLLDCSLFMILQYVFAELDINNKSELIDYLCKVQNDFDPPLFDRIKNRSNVANVENYAEKLLNNANVLVYKNIKTNDIIGLIAIYTNDRINFEAYIPLLSVHVDWSGKGLASKLIEHSIQTAIENGMKTIKVKTWSSNYKAIALYTKFEFRIVSKDEFNVMFIKEIV